MEHLEHDLGLFEAFNFRSQSAISRLVTAEEIVNWDHDGAGEAEFWPRGDRPEICLLFKSHRAGSINLRTLDQLLSAIGNDDLNTFLKIYYLLNVCCFNWDQVTSTAIEDSSIEIFTGSNFVGVRKEAAYSLFKRFYPVEYAAWEKSTCDGGPG